MTAMTVPLPARWTTQHDRGLSERCRDERIASFDGDDSGRVSK